MIWYSSMYLFTHEGKTRKNSFKILKDVYGRERLIIDYIKWRKSSLRFTNKVYRHIFLEAITMHNFATLCILLITLPSGSNKPYLVLVILTFLSSLYEHFKKTPKQIGEVDIKKKAE